GILLSSGSIAIPPYVDMEKIASDQPKSSIGYAEPGQKKFPINSKANTWLSIHYFNKTAEHLDDYSRSHVYDRLCDAARAWGVPVPKTWTGGADKLAMDKTAMVRNEMTRFDLNHRKVGFRERRRICKEIVKEAMDLGVEIPYPIIRQYASDDASDFLREKLEIRKMLNDNEELHKKLNTLVKVKDKVTVDDLIDALADLDGQYGLSRDYDGAIEDPVLTITQVTESTEEDHPVLTIGNLDIDPSDLSGVFDDSVIKSLQTDEGAIKKLTPTAQEILERHAKKNR
ncbi:MAG: hypothetical protein SVK08_01925, partial [Halobacteriota archaeon]|nr:hypothetical protein [Halobacteriota archaeon]